MDLFPFLRTSYISLQRFLQDKSDEQNSFKADLLTKHSPTETISDMNPPPESASKIESVRVEQAGTCVAPLFYYRVLKVIITQSLAVILQDIILLYSLMGPLWHSLEGLLGGWQEKFQKISGLHDLDSWILTYSPSSKQNTRGSMPVW